MTSTGLNKLEIKIPWSADKDSDWVATHGSHERIVINMHDKHRWFVKMLIHILETFIAKNKDYAGEATDWKSNFMGGGLRGIYNRMWDKMSRIRNYLRGQRLNNEGFKDSCEDLAVYALILRQAQIEGMLIGGTDWEGYN